jgi:spore coat protein U-like protein
MRNLTRIILASALALGIAGAANAGTATGNMAVTANATKNCVINSATMDFGTFSSRVAANIDATGTIAVQCSPSTAWSITPNGGLNAANKGTSDAAMNFGTNYLTYNLYREATHTTSFNATQSISGTSDAAATLQNASVYGRIPATQVVPAGAYADTMVLTIAF